MEDQEGQVQHGHQQPGDATVTWIENDSRGNRCESDARVNRSESDTRGNTERTERAIFQKWKMNTFETWLTCINQSITSQTN